MPIDVLMLRAMTQTSKPARKLNETHRNQTKRTTKPQYQRWLRNPFATSAYLKTFGHKANR